jgi:hypothetical protein
MGKSPAQKKAKEMRGKNKKRRRQKPTDPRTSAIVPRASAVKITRADGSVEIQQPLKPSRQIDKPYAPVRPKKAF